MKHEDGDKGTLDKATPSPTMTLTQFTSSFIYINSEDTPLTPNSLEEAISVATKFIYRVGLLGACGHMSLGILVGLDQQLNKAGNDGSLLQRGMVGRAQGQIPDQADGCLARKEAVSKGLPRTSGGSQLPSCRYFVPPVIP